MSGWEIEPSWAIEIASEDNANKKKKTDIAKVFTTYQTFLYFWRNAY